MQALCLPAPAPATAHGFFAAPRRLITDNLLRLVENGTGVEAD
jgi:hypothetical protein